MADRLHIARQFATALDNEDYATAEALLAKQCKYECRGELIHGPTDIISSYRGNGEKAKKLEAIKYQSSVVAEADGRYRIQFSDHLAHAGRKITFRCDQSITLDDSGLVIHIRHIDLPGEVEALSKFMGQIAPKSRID